MLNRFSKFRLRKPLYIGVSLVLIGLISTAFQPSDLYFRIKKNFEIFSEAYSLVVVEYVDQIDPAELMHVGIKAMFNYLDPYTNFFDVASNERAEIMGRSNFAGIGLNLDIKNGKTFVVQVIDGSPAQRAGVRIGDEITHIEELPTGALELEEMQNLLMGESGSTIHLSIKTALDQTSDVVITRAKLEPKSLSYGALLHAEAKVSLEYDTRGQMIDIVDSTHLRSSHGFAYVKIDEFGQGVNDEFRSSLYAMIQEGNVDGLIIDLRGNPGGILQESVQILDYLLESNITVVQTKGRLKEYNANYVTREDIKFSGPLVVLINEGSASASEIVSGVIQDLDRGVILGETSFGKGLVQIVKPLPYNNSMKYTISRYYIPSGRSIQSVDYLHDTMQSTRSRNGEETMYKTSKGRLVRGGRGVEPDVSMNPNLLDSFQSELLRLGFVQDYIQTASIKDASEIHDQFIQNQVDDFLTTFDARELQTWKRMIQQADSLAEQLELSYVLDSNIEESLQRIYDRIDSQAQQFLLSKREEIGTLFELEYTRFYEGNRVWKRTSLAHDALVIKALELLDDAALYSSYLN